MPDDPRVTAAQRKGGYESGDGPLPDPESLPTGPAPGAQKKATDTAAQGSVDLALVIFMAVLVAAVAAAIWVKLFIAVVTS